MYVLGVRSIRVLVSALCVCCIRLFNNKQVHLTVGGEWKKGRWTKAEIEYCEVS